MILKLAIKNVLRQRVKTALYFFVIFLVSLTVSLGATVNSAVDKAEKELEENYVFVVTLTKRVGSDNAVLFLSDVEKCLKAGLSSAYNIRLTEYAGLLPEGGSLHDYEQNAVFEEASEEYNDFIGCNVVSTNNIMLEPDFFSGKCKLISGGFDEKSYRAETNDIIIPLWVAEQYDFSVGDTIVRKLDGGLAVIYRKFTVSGIYSSSDAEKPGLAYITHEANMCEYIQNHSKIYDGTNIPVTRADFVLENRDDFEAFVNNAEKNGIDFLKCAMTLNSAEYDKLKSGLDNIKIISLLLITGLTFAGVLIFVFFTKYFINSRKHTDEILRALGMTKRSVKSIFIIETVLIMVLSAPVGVLCGHMGANGVFGFVNNAVNAQSEAAAEIISNAGNISMDSEAYLPLECNLSVDIGSGKTTSDKRVFNLDMTGELKENDVGLVYRKIYDCHARQFADAISSEWEPKELVGATDLSVFGVTDETESNEELAKKASYFMTCFVSEESGYKAGDMIRIGLFLPFGDFYYGDPSAKILVYNVGNMFLVAGTYKSSEYCKGTDILVDRDSFEKVYEDLTLYGEGFHFTVTDKIITGGKK